jgi:hypothetical protein
MEAGMKASRRVLMAGIAAIALNGTCAVAVAGGQGAHAMTVALPDGGTAVIQYTGDVAPKVSFATDPAAAEIFGPDSPFAAMERILAQMDREMAAMMQQANMMAVRLPSPDQVFNADLRDMPAGATEYSVVSSLTGNGFCSRSTEITNLGNGEKPKVVTHTAGDCGNAKGVVEQPTAPSDGPDAGLTTIATRPGQTVPRARQWI